MLTKQLSHCVYLISLGSSGIANMLGSSLGFRLSVGTLQRRQNVANSQNIPSQPTPSLLAFTFAPRFPRTRRFTHVAPANQIVPNEPCERVVTQYILLQQGGTGRDLCLYTGLSSVIEKERVREKKNKIYTS